LTYFRKNTQILNFLKSRVVQCGQTDGKIDRQVDVKLVVAFRNFANAPENVHWSHFLVSCTLRFRFVLR